MSTGSAVTPLLKAAPEPGQIAERLELGAAAAGEPGAGAGRTAGAAAAGEPMAGAGPAGGGWRGLELCLMASHVASDEALARTIEQARGALPEGVAVTAEAPVSWPSGAHVRVDRLDEEARAGIERSARFAAAVGSPVLTIHLFAPMTPEEYRRGAPLDEATVEAFLDHYARACAREGVTPLIENVPPVLRMRTGGVFLTPVGGHWRDLQAWKARVPDLRFTFDTSHAALFEHFAHAYPSLFGLTSADDLALERWVEEIGADTDVAHVSDAAGLLGEGLPYGTGELDLDPVVARLAAAGVRYVVAEVNEPDPARSPAMKAGYRAIERALTREPGRPARHGWRLPPDPFDWQHVTGRVDPVPAVLELEERLAGGRVLVTGGAGSIGRALTTFLAGFRPELIAVLDSNEAALADDRRLRDPAARTTFQHVLCDVRDGARLHEELARAAPDVVFHLAAYKHVDMAERYPEEFVATNLEASRGLLDAAEALAVRTVVVASTDKAATRASLYAKTKLLMEQLTAEAAGRAGAERLAVRLVNVLGSAGSASELFLRQARAGVPLTVTDAGMQRYWITRGHAAVLVAHAALLAGDEERLATAAGAAELTVGEMATRVWRAAGRPGEPDIDVVGIRPGETMDERLVGEGETLGDERHQGIAPIDPGPAVPWLAGLLDGVGRLTRVRERRAAWLEALRTQDLAGAAAEQAPR